MSNILVAVNRRASIIGSLVLLLLIIFSPSAKAERYAFMVGIDRYDDESWNLRGAKNDIMSVRSAIIDGWGFEENNVISLVDEQATKKNILQKLETLVEELAPGDHLFFYFAGHGTSAHAQWKLPLPHSTGALVPADFPSDANDKDALDHLIVGKTDLRPLLERADRKGVQVFAAFDACYSGQAVRGHAKKTRPRFLPRSVLRLPSDDNPGSSGDQLTEQEPYPYSRVYYIGAAGESEKAVELGPEQGSKFTTIDGKIHGAFSNTLVEILYQRDLADLNNDNVVTYRELHSALKDKMQSAGYPQSPRALPGLKEDSLGLGSLPIFFSESSNKETVAEAELNSAPDSLVTVAVEGVGKSIVDALDLISDVNIVANAADYSIRQEQDIWYLTTRSGEEMREEGFANVENIVNRLHQEVWLQKQRRDVESRSHLVTLEVIGDRDGVFFLQDDRLGLQVVSDIDSQLVLLNVDAFGNISVLYPSNRSELGIVPADNLVEIPGDKPGDWTQIHEPFGRETVIALAIPNELPELSNFRGRFLSYGTEEMSDFKQLIESVIERSAITMLNLVTSERRI